MVRTLHSCCIRFPDVAPNVIPLLMEFLSDSVNDEASAADVLVFTREAMAKFDHLRPTIIERLLEAFSTIKSARISRAALWILGEYCNKPMDIQAVMNEIRQSLGEIPIVEDEMRKGENFSKVKLSTVISTTFEFSRQKGDTKLLKNGTFQSMPN